MEPDTPASLGLVPASSSGTLGTPTQPLFHYEDIVITQLSSLAQHIQTEGQVAVRGGGGGGGVGRLLTTYFSKYLIVDKCFLLVTHINESYFMHCQLPKQ